jgi:hypothetical protein
VGNSKAVKILTREEIDDRQRAMGVKKDEGGK